MLFLLGVAAALVASACFNVGVVLQALEARTEPKSLELRLSLLAALLRRRRWLLGLALGLVGVVPQLLALALAPFTVVQPALSMGLLFVLAIGARTFDERVRWPEWVGVAAIIAGVTLVVGGSPTHADAHRGGAVVIAVVVVPLLIALTPFPLRSTRFDTAAFVVIAAGVGFAATNIATKLTSDDLRAGSRWNAAAWLLVALVAGIAATLTNMTAFQRWRATTVVPVVSATQTYLPIVLEPLFLRERWSSAPLDGVPIALGLVVAAAGGILVARTPVVGELSAAASGDAGRACGERGAREPLAFG